MERKALVLVLVSFYQSIEGIVEIGWCPINFSCRVALELEDVQKTTDTHIKAIDDLLASKEAELMEV